jgi:Fe-S-cluster containining protein
MVIVTQLRQATFDSVTPMPDSKWLYFTVDRAVDAIARDFEQYPPQVSLCSTLWPMVYGQNAYLMPGSTDTTMWAKMPAIKRPIVVNQSDLGHWIVRHLKQADMPLDRLASICRLVFQMPAVHHVAAGEEDGSGIWINAAMDNFVCRQCGRCCRHLNYRDGCSVADYQRWQKLGRHDILAWVGTVKHKGEIRSCRIWMIPGSNRYAERCPWLKSSPEINRFVCTIHDVRPTICRQYPGSRKHARMTGCPGV